MTATNSPHAPAASMSGSRRPPASVLHTFVSVLSVQMVMRRYVADTSCAADVPRERPDLLHWCKWLSNAPCAHHPTPPRRSSPNQVVGCCRWSRRSRRLLPIMAPRRKPRLAEGTTNVGMSAVHEFQVQVADRPVLNSLARPTLVRAPICDARNA